MSEKSSLGLSCHGRQPVVVLGYAVGLVLPSGVNSEGLVLNKLLFDQIVGHLDGCNLRWEKWLSVELAVAIFVLPLFRHVLGGGALFLRDPLLADKEPVCRTIQQERTYRLFAV